MSETMSLYTLFGEPAVPGAESSSGTTRTFVERESTDCERLRYAVRQRAGATTTFTKVHREQSDNDRARRRWTG